jgi:hypothetical protein
LTDKHRTQKEIWSGYMRTLGQVLAVGPISWLWRVIMKLVNPPAKIVPVKRAPPSRFPKRSDNFTVNTPEIIKILNQIVEQNGRQ